MPKHMKDKRTTKSISFYNYQLDRIALILGEQGGTFVDFVRQAIDRELDRLEGKEEKTTKIGDDSILMPTYVYRKLFNIKDSAFSRRKKTGKINVVMIGGKQFVEIKDKSERSIAAEVLTLKDELLEKYATTKELLNEYMERVIALEETLSQRDC